MNDPTTRCIRFEESGGDYLASGYEYRGGAWQFNAETWWSLGMTGYPNEASAAVQDGAAYRLWLRDGGSYREWQTASECGG